MIKLLRTSSFIVPLVLCLFFHANSQDIAAINSIVLKDPEKFLKRINGNVNAVNNRIARQTERYLSRMSREEAKLKRKLAAKDSAAARQLFSGAEEKYSSLQQKINSTSAKAKSLQGKYLPRLDSLQTALKLLNSQGGLLQNLPVTGSNLDKALNNLDDLQERFHQTEEIQEFLKGRKQFLENELEKVGMVKELREYKKQLYYYRSQVEEYKNAFNDPSMLQFKVMEMLKQTSLFRDFFGKYSQLAAMFNPPYNAAVGLNVNVGGLQTRDHILQVMTKRFGSVANVQQMFGQQVQGSVSTLNQLKDKISQLVGTTRDLEIPDFKPNNQKVKQWKNRLELGTNLQTVKSNRFFPSTSDIGISIGYKLNDKSIIGIGGSYKMGWGKDIRHIIITHEGMGIRSFIDYKIKGNIWLTGGGEMNYKSEFDNFEVLNNYSAWQTSALVGISKKYKVSNKMKGNAQLMYDLLWKEQVPRTQPVLFRVGYHLK